MCGLPKLVAVIVNDDVSVVPAVKYYRKQTSAEEEDIALFTQPCLCICGHIDADGVHNVVPNRFTV